MLGLSQFFFLSIFLGGIHCIRDAEDVKAEVQADGGVTLLALTNRMSRTHLLEEVLTDEGELDRSGNCIQTWQQCGGQGYTGATCCYSGNRCVVVNSWYSQCKPNSSPSPTPSPQPAPVPIPPPSPPPQPAPAPRPSPSPSPGWKSGTWTTGYWDCCKPSCSWPGKGNVNSPVRACDASTGRQLSDPNVQSVCNGGSGASCTSYQPFKVNNRLSYGFAAAAVSGSSGLSGDQNCGQCYELRFVNRKHPDGNWGGAHPDLVGKSMVVQVTNIGYDVTGDHSFDIQIPGAGQGAFTSGCTRQFQGYRTGDFDCDKSYGGCDTRSGCSRLPGALQAGCNWRFDWYRWLIQGGQTNNPYVDFRRVRCPSQLTSLSGSVALDDNNFPQINPANYA